MERNRVFLSYSHADVDQEWIRAFVDGLRANKIDVWWDAAISPGESFRDSIERGLRDSETMLIIVSDAYLTSPWSAFELGAGLAQRKTLIPIAMEHVDPSRWPESLRSRRWIRQSTPAETAQELAKSLLRPSDN